MSLKCKALADHGKVHSKYRVTGQDQWYRNDGSLIVGWIQSCIVVNLIFFCLRANSRLELELL